MKFRTTRKAIKENYTNIIKVGYCNLEELLKCKLPIAYTTRREGWACDIYEISPNTVISTGYAPFGNIEPDYDVCEKFNEEAMNILCAPQYKPYEEKKQELENLLQKFRKEVIK